MPAMYASWRKIYPGFNRRVAKILGIAQVIFGLTWILFEIIHITVFMIRFEKIYGHGIWCGSMVSMFQFHN